MAVTNIQFSTPTTIIASTSTTTSAPSGSTDGYRIPTFGEATRNRSSAVLVSLDYTGTVSGTLRYYQRKGNGTWMRGDSFAMSGTDETAIFSPGEGKEFTFAVEAISGGGTVVVSAEAMLT